MHFKVQRASWNWLPPQGPARACDPVLKVLDERTLTDLPLMVTCKRCVLTRAYKAAAVPA